MNLIPVCGLVLQEVNGLSIRAIINERDWGRLTAQPEATVVSILKEFYANAVEAKDKVAIVRGKSVPFDSVHQCLL